MSNSSYDIGLSQHIALLISKRLLSILAFGVVMGLLLALTHRSQPTASTKQLSEPTQASASSQPDRTIDIVSSNAQGYTPAVINLKYGETVKFKLTTEDQLHSFTLPDYNIDQMIPSGKATELVFHATTRGTFTFFCAVPCPMVKSSGVIIVS